MSWGKIIADWVIRARVSDVARPETPREPKGNITDDLSRCINEDVWYKYIIWFLRDLFVANIISKEIGPHLFAHS